MRAEPGPRQLCDTQSTSAVLLKPNPDDHDPEAIDSDDERPGSLSRSRVEDFVEQILSEGELEIQDEERRDKTYELGITETDALKRIAKPPFEAVIKHLTKLPKYRKPIDKMRIIAQCNRMVVKTINDFWHGVEGVKPKDLVLDVDQLLMIMTFVTVRC